MKNDYYTKQTGEIDSEDAKTFMSIQYLSLFFRHLLRLLFFWVHPHVPSELLTHPIIIMIFLQNKSSFILRKLRVCGNVMGEREIYRDIGGFRLCSNSVPKGLSRLFERDLRI